MDSSRVDAQLISAKGRQSHLASQPFIELTACFPVCVKDFADARLSPAQRDCLASCLGRYAQLGDELHDTANLHRRNMLQSLQGRQHAG